MSIALVITDRNAEKLQKLLQERLPEDTIECWPNISKPEQINYAVMWKHPTEIWQQLPNLKVAQSLGAGVDHFTYDKNIPQDIILSRIVDSSLADQMAEYVLATLLMRQCRLTAFAKQQANHQWKFQRRLLGKKVCVLGVGKIGDVVARKLLANNFDVIGWSRSKKTDKPYACFNTKADLLEQLTTSDYVVNLLPDTPTTQGLINHEFLRACKKNTWIVNVGRGNTIDETALIKACKNVEIAGATLDVFKQEPLPDEHPFWQMDNIDITPHIAAITDQSEIIEQVAKNYLSLQNNAKINNVVSVKLGY